MKPIKEKKTKKHYYIIHDGVQCGESWAVSPEKAICNWRWKHCKDEDCFTSTEFSVDDFDAVEA